MTDQVVVRQDAERAKRREAADHDLKSLRAILIGPAEQQIRALQARFDDRSTQARDVGAVLPQALLHRAGDPELARALTPPVEQAITASVRRNPAPLADALFPVIGPAIRRAVAASLASMVESLNRTVDHSLSWRAIQWRIEAFKTGKPFGEIVLLHTLLYRVEQVFLIHRRTGLLLQHVRAGPAQVEDAQLVSAMLTAIRDFARDSFHVSEHDSLDSFEVGELSVWIEQGPEAVLAMVVRGSAPHERRVSMQRTLEAVHLQYADALASFDGDGTPFEPSRILLEECLKTEYRPAARRGGRRILLAFALLTAVLLGLWAASWVRENRRWTRSVEALAREPGLVVLSTGRSGGRYTVAGLRDPLARDPSLVLQQAGLAPDAVVQDWEPYQALTSDFVLARAERILRPPPGTRLEIDDGLLSVTGDPPVGWIAEALRLTPLIAGVAGFEAAPLLASRMETLVRAVEGTSLLFERGRSQMVPGQEARLRQLADRLRELDAAGAATQRVLHIEVVGHTDNDGAPASNLPLSRARAERALAALTLPPLQYVELSTLGVGSTDPLPGTGTEADKARNRRVSLRVRESGAAGEGTAR